LPTSRKTPKDIDDYIHRFPRNVQQLLEKMRATIAKAAPGAEETISYGIPAFRQDGILVWFAAFKHHMGFYPGASSIAIFKKELSTYKSTKGAVQFPLDKPLPLPLVSRIVKFRVRESLDRKRNASERAKVIPRG
jgi:uncharacterized protein YdhG (YjbR/CyaY superfamily)